MNEKELLDDLNLFPKDINRIVLEYVIGWMSSHQWETSAVPYGLTSIGNNLVVCFPYSDSILIYTLRGVLTHTLKGPEEEKPKEESFFKSFFHKKQHLPTFQFPSDIDSYENQLYIIDSVKVWILTSNYTLLHFFLIQHMHRSAEERYVRIAVDNKENIYVAIHDDNDRYGTLFTGILVYNEKGTCKKSITTIPKKFCPRGITINNTFLYICDVQNHRIIVLDKKNGEYQTEWGSLGQLLGQFYLPFSIKIKEEMYYVCDLYSIQLHNKEGKCLERIEKWENETLKCINGICFLQKNLVICDGGNIRIRVFSS